MIQELLDPPEREVDLIRHVAELLRNDLPMSWSVKFELERRGDRSIDGLVTVSAPNGPPVYLAIEAKRTLISKDVRPVLDQLQKSIDYSELPGAVPTVVARYLSPTVRDRIASMEGGYLDATGNALIESKTSAMFVRLSGEDSDPWRGPGRPRGSLRGAPAARVVRALIDYAPPYSVPELVDRSGASTGATYRVVKFLEEEDLLEREQRGQIERIEWPIILQRWSKDYGFDRADVVESYLEPRSIADTLGRLQRLDREDYAITGSFAAQLDAPYAPARLLSVYLRDPSVATEVLGLRRVPKGANVRIAANEDEFAFARSRQVDGLCYAAVSQVAVDLMSGPGRSPSEAQELISWMQRNEDAWRR